jgi:hypothetical protein
VTITIRRGEATDAADLAWQAKHKLAAAAALVAAGHRPTEEL